MPQGDIFIGDTRRIGCVRRVMEVKQPRQVAIWDPVVRDGHWLLVAAFFVAYLSAEEESGGVATLMSGAGTSSAPLLSCACCGGL